MKAKFLLLVLFFFFSANAQSGFNYDAEKEKAKEFFNQGLVLYHQASYEAAIKKFFESLAVSDVDQAVRYYLGLAFYKAGYVDNALEQWENILLLGAQDAFLSQKIDQIYSLRGQGSERPLMTDFTYVQDLPVLGGAWTNLQTIDLPTGLIVSDSGQFYLLDFSLSRLLNISENGDILEPLYLGLSSQIPGQFGLKNPYNLIWDTPGQSFFISDFGHNRLVRMDSSGKILDAFGSKGIDSNGLFLGPQGLTADDEGLVYISDVGNSQIQIFNSQTEQFIHRFGERGKGQGQLSFPSGLSFNTDYSRLYVANRGNNRIEVFGPYGEFIDSLGEGFLNEPRAVLQHPEKSDYIFIADLNNVYLYDLENTRYKSIFYNINDYNFSTIQPVSLGMDKLNLLYIGDAISGKVRQYSPLPLLYVNLLVQIERIYMQNFPEMMVKVSVLDRRGEPIRGLEGQNFTLKENNIEKELKLMEPDPIENQVRTSVMLEHSFASRNRQSIKLLALEELFATYTGNERYQLITVGGGAANGEASYKKLTEFNTAILANIERVKNEPVHQSQYWGTALKRTIGDHLDSFAKDGIILVLTEALNENQFIPENSENIINYARNSGIPISILYIGPGEASSEAFALSKKLCARTGGIFIRYENAKTAETILGHHRNFHNGRYYINYQSFENNLKYGMLRKLSVQVDFKSLSGLDQMGAYPIPR